MDQSKNSSTQEQIKYIFPKDRPGSLTITDVLIFQTSFVLISS